MLNFLKENSIIRLKKKHEFFIKNIKIDLEKIFFVEKLNLSIIHHSIFLFLKIS